MCFIGHGIFGWITKPVWCNYFAVFGIGHDLAYRLMPVVGSIDIWCGCLLLLYPLRAVFLWLVVWGFTTALLRPLSGEPIAEFFERAGNFGAPLCLLMLAASPRRAILGLRITAFLLLAGHGWLNLLGKGALLQQYTRLGATHPLTMADIAGCWEILGAVLLLIKPVRPLVAILLVWKMCSELLYPHYEVVEWIERGGSYGVLLALWFGLKQTQVQTIVKISPNGRSAFL
jgi:uncharacterized membrane protein YphA (DoxX/SURF4 family)